LFPWLLTLISL